jgi:hypothetical protein
LDGTTGSEDNAWPVELVDSLSGTARDTAAVEDDSDNCSCLDLLLAEDAAEQPSVAARSDAADLRAMDRIFADGEGVDGLDTLSSRATAIPFPVVS